MGIVIWIKLSVCVICLVIEAIIMLLTRKYRAPITGQKYFIFEKLYFIGAGLSSFHFVRNKSINRRRKDKDLENKLFQLYDVEKINDIKCNIKYCKFTYIVVFLPFVLVMFLFVDNRKIVIFLCFFLLFFLFLPEIEIRRRAEVRRENILKSYPSMLTKMGILVSAGITAFDAFEKVAYSSSDPLYIEMQSCVKSMKNGVSFERALDRFSNRCGCKEIKKFVSLCKQNLSKGGAEFPFLLSEIANVAWEERKSRAKLTGERASIMLLFPIILMFAGILIMVIVPAFAGLI